MEAQLSDLAVGLGCTSGCQSPTASGFRLPQDLLVKGGQLGLRDKKRSRPPPPKLDNTAGKKHHAEPHT